MTFLFMLACDGCIFLLGPSAVSPTITVATVIIYSSRYYCRRHIQERGGCQWLLRNQYVLTVQYVQLCLYHSLYHSLYRDR